MPERVALLEQYPRFAGYAAGLDGTALNRRSVNDSKVTDHHALIITENLPGELSKDERAVYELVAGRMQEAFSGKCVKDVTTALLSGGDTDFTVKGSVMKVTGWRAVFGEQETCGDEEAASLPPLQEGEACRFPTWNCWRSRPSRNRCTRKAACLPQWRTPERNWKMPN